MTVFGALSSKFFCLHPVTESNEGGVFCKLQEFDGLMTRDAAVLKGQEQKR